MKIKRLLVIPARSGSKRIKNKNIKLFFGKPIISYPIKEAVKSKLFEKIHVSTDSSKIAKITKKFGAVSEFFRPKKLSRDNVSLFDVLKYVKNQYQIKGVSFDQIWCILPASPLIDSNDIKKIVKFYGNKNKPMIAASPYPAPLNWSFEVKNGKMKNINKNINNSNFNQKKAYYDSGQIYCFNNAYLLKKKFDFKDDILIYTLPLEKSVDIDNNNDFEFAKVLFKGLIRKNKNLIK